MTNVHMQMYMYACAYYEMMENRETKKNNCEQQTKSAMADVLI